MTNANILVACAETDAAFLEERLRGLGYSVRAAVSSGPEAIEKAAETRPDLALVDLALDGGAGGIELAGQLGGRFGVPVVFLLSAEEADDGLPPRAPAAEPFGYVLKPFDPRQLHLCMQTALSMRERERRRAPDVRSAARDAPAKEPAGNGAAREVEELRHRVHVMETVFESMSDGLVVADENERYLFRNAGAERLIGATVPGLTFERVPELFGFHRPDGETLLTVDELPLTRAVRRGESCDEVEVFVRNPEKPDGVSLSMNGRPIRDAEGRLKGGVVVMRDITRLKQAENRLLRSNEELRAQTRLMETVFESMSDGLIVTEPSARAVIFNRGAVSLLGPPQRGVTWDNASEAYGIYEQDRVTLVPPRDLPMARALRGESPTDVRAFVRNGFKPEGAWVSVSARPLGDESGAVRGSVSIFRDVTELVRSETKIRESNETLRRQLNLMEIIFESISDGVVVADEDEKYLMRNRSAERLTGRYVPGTSFDRVSETYGLFRPDGETPFPDGELPLTRAVREGVSSDGVEMFVRGTGGTGGRYVSVNGRPLRDEAGRPMGGAIVIRDVTERKNMEFSLRQVAGKLEYQTGLMKIIFDNVNDGLVVADEQGRYLMHNRSMEAISGMKGARWDPDRQSESHTLWSADGATLVPEEEHPLARAARGESTDEFEAFVRTTAKPAGVPVSISGKTLRDARGAMWGGISIYRDLTAIKKAEEDLKRIADEYRHQSETLESIFNSLGEAVTVTDETGRIIRFNPAAERIVGVGMVHNHPKRYTEKFGLFFPDQVSPVPYDRLPQVRVLNGERFDDLELFVCNPKIPDGVHVSINANPIRDAHGKVRGGVIAFRDVTERHLAEEALAEAFADGRLEILDTLLHNIGNAINSVAIGVGSVQEQLRTSRIGHRLAALASALGEHRDDWLEYLTSDPQGRQVLPFVLALAEDFGDREALLRSVVDRVEDRVEHIVDIIRTQKSIGERPMVRTDVDLRVAIDDAVRMMQESITKRGIEVRVDCREGPREIRVPASRFNQMLVNLVKNAIEAIEDLDGANGPEVPPRIRIDSYVEKEFLVIDVIDNGIGIHPDRFRIIFAPGHTSKGKGSGLGLHSSANFVLSSGGSIEPLSEGAGSGTTMRVRMRLSSVAPSFNGAGSAVGSRTSPRAREPWPAHERGR